MSERSTTTAPIASAGWLEPRRITAGAPLLAVAAVLAAIAAVTVVSAGIRGGTPPAHSQAVRTLPTTTAVDPALRGSFSILEGGSSATAIHTAMRVPAIAAANPVGANPMLARRAVAGNGDVMAIVPANHGVCLVSGTHIGCVPTAMAKHGYGVGLGETASGISVSGLAPDGVETVRLRLANGSVRTAAVGDNVYSVRAPDVGTRAISYERNGHSVTVPFATRPVDSFAVQRGGSLVRVR